MADAPIKLLNVFCHLERLGPSYRTGYVHFSVNLTAAITRQAGASEVTQDEVVAYLRPWEWVWTKVRVRGVFTEAGVDVTAPIADEPLLTAGLPSANDTAAFRGALDAALHRVIKIDPVFTPEPFLWDPDAPLSAVQMNARRANWRACLGEMSQYPAPLPQSVRLTGFFHLPLTEVQKYRSIVALPIFEGTTPPGPAEPKVPGPSELSLHDMKNPIHEVALGITAAAGQAAPVFYRWNYALGTGAPIPVIGWLKECPVSAPMPGDTIDLSTLLVDNPPVVPRDWTQTFEHQIAEAFDLPARVLEVFSAYVESLTTPPATYLDVRTLVVLFKVVLRDLANDGLEAGPDGAATAISILEQLRTRKHPNLPTDEQLLSDLTVRSWNMDAAAWESLLIRLLGKQGPLFPDLAPASGEIPDPPADGASAEVLRAYRDRLRDIVNMLRRTHGLLMQEDALRSILVTGWVETFNAQSWFTADVRRSLGEILETLSLRRRLSVANVGPSWRTRLRKRRLDIDEPLLQALRDAFEAYVEIRLETSPPEDPYVNYLPLPVPLGSEIAASLKRHLLTTVAPAVVQKVREEATGAAAIADGLAFQIREPELVESNALDGSDQADVARRIAGVGVLLRQKGAAEWRCLNLAALDLDGAPLSFATAVAVPERLQYRNGMRHSCVVYNNLPMAARSPSADLTDKEFEPETADAYHLLDLDYRAPYGSAIGLRLEPLVYGREYEAIIYAHGVAGNLPSALAAEASADNLIPWKFRTPDSSLPPRVRPTYGRRVQVGPVRMVSKDPRKPGQEAVPLPWPRIPDNVFPIARSLPPVQRAEESTVLLLEPRTSAFLGTLPPTFEFTVKPPTVDFTVWDRWVADHTLVDLKGRLHAWQFFHQLSDTLADKKDAEELSFDDPAVTTIRFEIRRIHPTSDPDLAQLELPLPAPVPNDKPDLSRFRTAGLPVKIETVTSLGTAKRLELVAGKVIVRVVEGEVAHLAISPMVPPAHRMRFAQEPQILDDLETRTDILVEVATPLLADAAQRPELSRQLLQSLRLGPETAGGTPNPNVFSVAIQKPGNVAWPDQIHDYELGIQAWRWDGRPLWHLDTNGAVLIPGFPFPKGPNPDYDKALEPHDGILFGSRHSKDRLEVRGGVELIRTAAGGTHALHRIDLSSLPGAFYYRTSIRASSRYAPLLRPEFAMLDGQFVEPGKKVPEPWRRYVVPCRWTKAVPAPTVKLVLPLTQALDTELTTGAAAGEVNASLLVVLDETFFTPNGAGLAEGLEAEILTVSLPDEDDRRYEFGPDPTQFLSDDPFGGRQVTPGALVGPIGYTFDTDTDAPLFRRASFVLDAPRVDGRRVPLWWHMVKVRFRRALNPAGLVSIGGERPVLAATTSEWSQPMWVQMLPPANRWIVSPGVSPADLNSLRFDPRTRQLILGGIPVEPKPSPSAPEVTRNHRVWALFTRPISDAFGRLDQEAFVCLVPWERRLHANVEIPDGARLRLVELQASRRCPDLPAGTTRPEDILHWLFARLFPAASTAPEDADARIVRMSVPVRNVT